MTKWNRRWIFNASWSITWDFFATLVQNRGIFSMSAVVPDFWFIYSIILATNICSNIWIIRIICGIFYSEVKPFRHLNLMKTPSSKLTKEVLPYENNKDQVISVRWHWSLPVFFSSILYIYMNISRWWFGIFFIFTPTWGRFQFWLIFFRWVETTNQICIV